MTLNVLTSPLLLYNSSLLKRSWARNIVHTSIVAHVRGGAHCVMYINQMGAWAFGLCMLRRCGEQSRLLYGRMWALAIT